jgi:hypothetical protein
MQERTRGFAGSLSVPLTFDADFLALSRSIPPILEGVTV